MAINKIALGSRRDAYQPAALKQGLAEFISTLIFVFVGQGSGMAYSKLTSSDEASGLIFASIAHGFALFVAVAISVNISGGHVNPAVTFGAFLGGRITLFRGILYIACQLVGSLLAYDLLYESTGEKLPIPFLLSANVSVWNALVFEIVMTFGLVYTVYATTIDPKKGDLGTIAPLAIGLIYAANILSGGAFTGASMNPAVAFASAWLSLIWTNHWVYWAGPLIGGGIAGLVYELFFICYNSTHEQLPTTDDYREC